jgi:hypothetical protein
MQNKRLSLLCKPALNIAFVYDEELLLFKQTYHDAALYFVGVIIRRPRHFLYSGDCEHFGSPLDVHETYPCASPLRGCIRCTNRLSCRFVYQRNVLRGVTTSVS